MASNMAALWQKLGSFQAREKDAGPAKRGTVSGESLDHTAKAMQIQENGNKAEDWLNYTRFIKHSVEFPDPVSRHNFLCGTYDLAIKAMSLAENKRNVSYAILLIEYANLKSQYSPDDARALFNYARVNIKRLAVVYIAAAQFELRQGAPGKCKKILEKAKMFDVQPSSLLQKAFISFEEGRSQLLTEEEMEACLKSETEKNQSGNTKSLDNTGDLSHTDNSRQPLAPLCNNFPKGFSSCPVTGGDSSKHSQMNTMAHLAMPREDSHTDHKPCFRNKDLGVDTGDVAGTADNNTAPIDMETESHAYHPPPPPPASCSRPPFRSYHSTPDVKSEKKALSCRGKSSKFVARRVKKLDIPVVTPEDEDSEDEMSFNDIKPLDKSQHDENRTLASESMNQSHPGHTSGYVSSVSMTSHTKTHHLPAATQEERPNKAGPVQGTKPATDINDKLHRGLEEKCFQVPEVKHCVTRMEKPGMSVPVKPHPVPATPEMLTPSISVAKPVPCLLSASRPVQPQSAQQPHCPQLSFQPLSKPMPSQPVFSTPSHHGVPVMSQQVTPMMAQYTPNMKSIQELCVNGKSYSILKVVGKGGSSKVYHCFDFDNQQSVGIKYVDLSDADETIIQGYKNEITLLKRLQYSDKVIKMYDYEHNKAQCCLLIVMELGDTDLASLFRNASKSKDITPSLMNYYWEAMLKAVKVLHKEGIIHSDLKPANFLLVKGQLKLIDFGIANAIQQDRTSVVRDAQVGTLNYMSPEAIADSCGGMTMDGSGRVQPRYKIGVKSDVWSLGCILYNMVYGRTPFQLITKPHDEVSSYHQSQL
ncbi:dual specificity protein kinase TTK-like [Liolophura sinensis]|uniref:dual specificity protein kinase TTK-like n=1 Tax=Liolophura sinensis TaxID=3198878 RepID=UPI0031585B2A